MDNQDTTKIEQSLSRVQVNMDKDWQAQTRAMLDQLSDEGNASEVKKERISVYTLFFNFFFMRHRNIALLGLAVLIVLVSGGLFFLSRSRQEIVTNQNFTEEQKREIFMNIIYNNPESVLGGVTGGNPSAPSQDSIAGKSINSNFIKTVSKTTHGSKANECGSYSEDGSIFTYYDFKDKNGLNYTRSDQYLGNEFRSTYIAKNVINEKNELLYQEAIQYEGGKYAVKSMTTYQPGSVTIGNLSDELLEETEEQNIEELITQHFGPHIKITGTKMERDEELYVLESEININCETGLTLNNNPAENIVHNKDYPNKKIFVYYIRTTDFMMKGFEEYIDTISQENLVSKIETTVEYKTVAFDKVSDIFSLDADIPVKTIFEGEDYSSSDPYSETVDQQLERVKNDVPFVLLVDGQGVDSTAYASILPQVNDSYRSDKDFYPDTEYGRSQLEGSSTFISSTPIFTTLITKQDEYMTSFQIDMHKGNINAAGLMNQWGYGAKEIDSTDHEVEFMVNGTKVNGTLRIKTVEEEIQYFTDENGNLVKNDFDPNYHISCNESTCTRKIINAVFEYNGFTFSLLNYYQLKDEFMMTKLNYSVYETNNEAHLKRIKEALEFVPQG